MSEAVNIEYTLKTGYGPWKVTYLEGVPVMIETWETDQDGTPTAHHRIRRQEPTVIRPDPDR